MFTGLIEATGRVADLQAAQGSRHFRIDTAMGAELRPGDSVAVNGVCLTVTEADARGFFVDVSPETLRVTTFAFMAEGRVVNLERPLKSDSRVGGHFVLGHVDAVGRVSVLRPDAGAHWLEIEFPKLLTPLLISKGSVAVDGISLTVAALWPYRCGIQIVPFTWQHTNLAHLIAGDQVNLEGDVLGKYVARSLETRGVIHTS